MATESKATEEEHPFTSYNKNGALAHAPTLIGNWVEEAALRDATGVSRYEVRKPAPMAWCGQKCMWRHECTVMLRATCKLQTAGMG
jgi:hypothetical protein